MLIPVRHDLLKLPRTKAEVDEIYKKSNLHAYLLVRFNNLLRTPQKRNQILERIQVSTKWIPTRRNKERKSQGAKHRGSENRASQLCGLGRNLINSPSRDAKGGGRGGGGREEGREDWRQGGIEKKERERRGGTWGREERKKIEMCSKEESKKRRRKRGDWR